MLAIFQELNSKGLYVSSKKQNENRCFVFTSSIKRQLEKFHVVVVVTAKKYTKERDARAKLLFCQSQRIAFFGVLVHLAVVVA